MAARKTFKERIADAKQKRADIRSDLNQMKNQEPTNAELVELLEKVVGYIEDHVSPS